MECMVCHGTKEAQRGPILDGMEVWYLTEQMEKFRAGIRGNRPSNRSEHLMGVGARKIESDLELAYLADWFANRPPVPAIRTVKGEVEKGKEFYEQRCASCHGANGEGNRLVRGPSLQRLEGWYFLEQMRKFGSGERGYPLPTRGDEVMAAAQGYFGRYAARGGVLRETFGPEEAPSNRDKYLGPKPRPSLLVPEFLLQGGEAPGVPRRPIRRGEMPPTRPWSMDPRSRGTMENFSTLAPSRMRGW